ncbi:MAG TPA: DUF427 domain-containing protein [Thermoleophilaceae bacterium]|nr:DUF427 domain-containing protein [Thermoleophilaceae bacterium]
MALTKGTGPFGDRPGGVFNFDRPDERAVIYWEDFPRRIRGSFAGEVVVDSRRAKLLHEERHLPILYFPEDEVRTELLEPTDHRTHCPWKGDARHWSLVVDGRVSENAAWSYPDPIAGAPPLAGHIAFYWGRVDEWLEEDEPMLAHMRDPYHRVDVLDSSRRVRVEVDGQVVAETDRPRPLFETGHPTRWYIPHEDVRHDLLVRSDTRTVCAYKGVASYHSVTKRDGVADDAGWFYSEPLRDAERVRDYVCFFNERVDLYVDGELQERPQTPWSR